jgi:ribosomal protein L32
MAPLLITPAACSNSYIDLDSVFIGDTVAPRANKRNKRDERRAADAERSRTVGPDPSCTSCIRTHVVTQPCEKHRCTRRSGKCQRPKLSTKASSACAECTEAKRLAASQKKKPEST